MSTLKLTSLFISGLAIPVPKTGQSATPAQVDLAGPGNTLKLKLGAAKVVS